VVLVGRIEPLKGIDALIEASAQILAARPALRGQYTALVVGGEPEDAPERWNAEQRRLGALRDALGLGDAVRFAGARTHEQLPLFYAAADIVTMPSHYESFGMAALEGLASGRPVVATDAGGPAFIIEDGVSGLLTPPAAPDRLASQLGRILDDDALAAQLAAGARQRARRFGWATIGCEIVQVYREVLTGARTALAV
jgi:D-inositol-3-phosphate glycosyltransferase